MRSLYSRSIVGLMAFVFVSALAVMFLKYRSGWDEARRRHLLFASFSAAHLQSYEAKIATEQPGPYRDWLSQMAQHYRALEEKHRQAAARPWKPVAPDPAEPDIPTFDTLLKWSASYPPDSGL